MKTDVVDSKAHRSHVSVDGSRGKSPRRPARPVVAVPQRDNVERPRVDPRQVDGQVVSLGPAAEEHAHLGDWKFQIVNFKKRSTYGYITEFYRAFESRKKIKLILSIVFKNHNECVFIFFRTSFLFIYHISLFYFTYVKVLEKCTFTGPSRKIFF